MVAVRSMHPAPPEFIPRLLAVMNRADHSELFTLSHGGPEVMLRMAVDNSVYSFAYEFDGAPVAAGGLVEGDPCVAWMVTASETIARYKKSYVAYNVDELVAMVRIAKHRPIVTHVDCRWRKSIKLLEWLGFDRINEFRLVGRDGVVLEYTT